MNSPKQNEKLREAVILKLTGTGLTASDRESFLAGAIYGAEFNAAEQKDINAPLIADVKKAAQFNSDLEAFLESPFKELYMDKMLLGSMREAAKWGKNWSANHLINLGYKSPEQVKAICKAVLERAADESDSGCYCSDGVSKQSILNIDLEEFLK